MSLNTEAGGREALVELERLTSTWVPELDGAPRTRKMFLQLLNSTARILRHHPAWELGGPPEPDWPPLRVVSAEGRR